MVSRSFGIMLQERIIFKEELEFLLPGLRPETRRREHVDRSSIAPCPS
jgi:hypothetical protein